MKATLQLALEALEDMHIVDFPLEDLCNWNKAITAIKEALRSSPNGEAQPEQEPVAMKFKIYKPTVPDPMRQGINNALLPWVYDQDRSSGFDASMWVTPVATLPPQRKPLTDEQIGDISKNYALSNPTTPLHFARAIEAAHGIKE